MLLEYLIRNDFRILCKQLFKKLPLDILGESVLSNVRVNTFVNSYYINLIYHLYNRRETGIEDNSVRILYVSYLSKTEKIQDSQRSIQISKNNEFLRSVIQMN